MMTHDQAARALAWVNAASPEQLEAAGVYKKGVEVVLGNRPFASMAAFAATPLIGTKTVDAVVKAAR